MKFLSHWKSILVSVLSLGLSGLLFVLAATYTASIDPESIVKKDVYQYGQFVIDTTGKYSEKVSEIENFKQKIMELPNISNIKQVVETDISWAGKNSTCKDQLSNYFSILQEHNITYLNMLGNDDLLSVDNLFEQTCGGFANVHNIAGKKICIDEYEFIGMNQILDHPFGCKDRVVTETDYIPQRQLSFFAGISNEYGYDRIFDWLEYSKTELPLMCGILKELPEPESPKKTVYVMHMPPAGLHLGQLLYQDLDIGSVDIYEFLKAKQPLLSLHGHIHESPDTEKGSWMNQIGTTTCIQPGQTEFGDSSMVYAEIDLKSGAYARRIVNI